MIFRFGSALENITSFDPMARRTRRYSRTRPARPVKCGLTKAQSLEIIF